MGGFASTACVQFAAAFGIVFLCILNVIVLIGGIGTVVIGTELQKEVDKRDDIMDLLDEVELGDITLKELVDILIRVVIGLGIFAIVTSLMGGFGALCKLRPILLLVSNPLCRFSHGAAHMFSISSFFFQNTYIVVVVFCIIVEIVALSYWIKLIDGVDRWLGDQFNELLKKYDGPTAKDLYSIGWNLIFIFFTCCGVKPTTAIDNDFRDLPASWWSSRGSDAIPSSCCDDVTEDNYFNYTNTACTLNLVDYHKAGCYDVFDDLFTRLSATAISIISFIVLVEIAAIFFSSVIVYVTSKRRVEIV